MNNVHDDQPIVFKSRFVMSYLAGPLTRPQLAALSKSAPRPSAPPEAPAAKAGGTRPVVPGGLPELFSGGTSLTPTLLGVVKLHYTRAAAEIDTWRELTVVAPLAPDTAGDFWEKAVVIDAARVAGASSSPDPAATFAALPAALTAKTVAKLDDGLEAWAYREAALTLWRVGSLDLMSRPGESRSEFAGRVAQATREARDAAIDKLRAKYRPKLDALAG